MGVIKTQNYTVVLDKQSQASFKKGAQVQFELYHLIDGDNRKGDFWTLVFVEVLIGKFMLLFSIFSFLEFEISVKNPLPALLLLVI